LKRQEREVIAAALRQTKGKVSGSGGAAELLGMNPSTLSSRIAALGLSRWPQLDNGIIEAQKLYAP